MAFYDTTIELSCGCEYSYRQELGSWLPGAGTDDHCSVHGDVQVAKSWRRSR